MPAIGINIELRGLTAFENLLVSLEPAVIESQIDAMRDVCKKVISDVRSNLSGLELANHIVGQIGYAADNQTFYMSVGVGDASGVLKKEKDRKSRDYNDPLRYGRWQEYGWQPKESGMSFSSPYSDGYTRTDGSQRAINPATGKPRQVAVYSNSTKPKRFIASQRDAAMQQVEAQVKKAFDAAVADLLDNGKQTLDIDDFKLSATSVHSHKKNTERFEIVQ